MTRLHLVGGFALATLIMAGGLAFGVHLAGPSGDIPEGGVLFTVPQGAGASSVAEDLQNSGYINSSLAFKLIARLDGQGSTIKSGIYRLEPGMGAKAMFDLFKSGRQELVRVTIPEGSTLSQVAALLEKRGVLEARDFLAAAHDRELAAEEGITGASFEGYLFPDTYFMPHSFQPSAAIRMMVAAFRKNMAVRFPESAALGAEELQKRIILASIIEREYRDSSEAPLMASVFYNRLKIGMALQSCATVVYVITEKLGKPHPDMVYSRDLKLPDPYNTYAHRGLPPGPICSPGAVALDAAFHPAASKYLYFRLINADTGTHHFSETLEEHNEAAGLIVKKAGGP